MQELHDLRGDCSWNTDLNSRKEKGRLHRGPQKGLQATTLLKRGPIFFLPRATDPKGTHFQILAGPTMTQSSVTATARNLAPSPHIHLKIVKQIKVPLPSSYARPETRGLAPLREAE